MPRVSVLLTTYNRPTMLQAAIDSVLRQTFRDFELLILDDNSDEPAQLIVLDRYRKHPKCRVFVSDVTPERRRERVRYAALANVGLAEAKGRYITYLCDDDYFLPHRLERMVGVLDQGHCQAVYGAQEMYHGDRLLGIRPATQTLSDAFCRVDHSSVMHTKAIGLEVGGWDDDPALWRFADGAFWRRLNRAGHHFHPIPEVLDGHRYHEGSVTSQLDGRLVLPA